ncbi:MAG: hypothetical protein VW124_22485 [Paracoccaceae bacterium]
MNNESFVYITIPKRLIRFVALYYGGFLGALWLTAFFGSVFCAVNYQPGLGPLWNPITSTIAKISLLSFMVGFAGLFFGAYRGLKLIPADAGGTKIGFLLFSILTPIIVALASSSLFRIALFVVH